MKVLVTGGAGFIGSHVVDALLNAGHFIRVIDNFSSGRPENLAHVSNKIELIEGDLCKLENLGGVFEGIDWVIHLAALADIVPSIQDPELYFHSNVTATLNVLSLCRAHNIKRLIYAASSSCYGLADVFPTPEGASLNPEYPYALTKLMGEQLIMHWEKVYGIPSLSLRFFNVYGIRSRTSGAYGAMFGVFLAQKLAGKPFTVVGDGSQKRDFTYVTDVADAVVSACSSDKSGLAYNVGSGSCVSVLEIVQKLGGDSTFIPKRPGEPNVTFADTSLIQKDLGWRPKVSLDTGVNNVLRDIQYWSKAKVWSPEEIELATKDWFKFLA
jgi:UDP-glucose 4-epimerase